MKTIKLITTCCLLLIFSTGFGQDVGGIIKRKINKRAKKEIEKTIDKGIDKAKGEEPKVIGDGPYGEIVVVSTDEAGINKPIENFIAPGSAVFVDDFNIEKPTEFPSKWTQVNGSLENNQLLVNGQKDGVVEAISNYSTLKPTIQGDSYLGNEFKIEIQVYFYGRGNEVYNVNLKNSAGPYRNHDLRIGYGTMHSGADNISRFPGGIQPGWHSIQYSFNKGHLKGFFDGVQLINDPKISRDVKYPKDTFTHLEIKMISPGSSRGTGRQTITYFAIGGKGHELYDRLIGDGKLILNNISFEVNSYTLTSNSFSVLDEIAEMMISHSGVKLTVEGHTDSDGTKNSNQSLSENRAASVLKYLTEKGVSSIRLSSTGFGEEKPLDNSGSNDAKAKNRRVEFILNK